MRRLWAPILAMSVALAPSTARAQSRASSRPEAPARARPHPNYFLVTAGAATFGIVYTAIALDAVTRYAFPLTNLDRAGLWGTIPIVGPFLVWVDYNQRQVSDCAVIMARPELPEGIDPSSPEVTSGPCMLPGGQMVPANSPVVPQPSSLVPRTAIAGDWIWATVQSAVQVFGISVFIAGLFAGHSWDVSGPLLSRNHRPVQWALTPTGPAGSAGVSLRVTHF